MKATREVLAWRIVLGAFVAFLLLCGGAVYLVQWYIWQSTVPLQVDLDVARGTVSIELPNSGEAIAANAPRPLDVGSVIATDSVSQATLHFSDGRTEATFASFTLFREGQVLLSDATTPRFQLNSKPYTVEISQFAGRSEVLLSEQASVMTIDLGEATCQLSAPGQYFIERNGDEIVITTRAGRANVNLDEGNILVASNTQLRIADDGDITGPGDAAYSLVLNNTFSRDQEWAFYHFDESRPEDDHTGRIGMTRHEGRPVVVIDRSQTQQPTLINSHGETGLTQNMNLDVSDFSGLEIRATFYIDEQSLSTCGLEGSECPIMLRVKYVDANGLPNEFIQGFYAFTDPQVDWPRACATCRTEHQQINMKSWYTYESGNLMTLLPPDARPTVIDEIQFYASGWAYRVYVSEVDLLAAE